MLLLPWADCSTAPSPTLMGCRSLKQPNLTSHELLCWVLCYSSAKWNNTIELEELTRVIQLPKVELPPGPRAQERKLVTPLAETEWFPEGPNVGVAGPMHRSMKYTGEDIPVFSPVFTTLQKLPLAVSKPQNGEAVSMPSARLDLPRRDWWWETELRGWRLARTVSW